MKYGVENQQKPPKPVFQAKKPDSWGKKFHTVRIAREISNLETTKLTHMYKIGTWMPNNSY